MVPRLLDRGIVDSGTAMRLVITMVLVSSWTMVVKGMLVDHNGISQRKQFCTLCLTG